MLSHAYLLVRTVMNILLVLAHPDSMSFNTAIAQRAAEALQKNGHTVVFHDLYKEGFDPMLPAREFQKNADIPADLKPYVEELSNADGIVIVHPNWWGQPPAILKGWVDRVFRPGGAYEFIEGDGGEGVPVGLLKAQSAIVFNTSNTPEERERDVFGDPLELIWKNCLFDLCGVKRFHRKMFRVIVTSTPEERKEWLNQVEETIGVYYPKPSLS